MKFKLGLIAGGAVGYYFGAMAGRERYAQLNRMLKKIKALDKAKAVVDLGVERARDAVEHKSNGDGVPGYSSSR